MQGIAGIARSGEEERVNQMLDRMSHRGRGGRSIFSLDGALSVLFRETITIQMYVKMSVL